MTQAQSFDFSFDHFSIVVEDVDKSAAFYANVLNLEETPLPDKTPGFRWFVINDNTQIHLIQKEFAPFEKNKSMHLALATQDLDGLIAHLKYNFRRLVGKEEHDKTPIRWGGSNLHSGSGRLLD